MAEFNLGNVTGLIISETSPSKKYVLWGKILDQAFPEIVQIYRFDGSTNTWVPNVEGGTLPPAISIGDTTPPVGPSIGDAYIVPDSATGLWSGKDNFRAEWNGLQWLFTPPQEGLFIKLTSELGSIRLYESGEWVIYQAGRFAGDPVLTIADLRAIDNTSSTSFPQGTNIFVDENNSVYQLNRFDVTNIDDNNLFVVPTVGVGVWKKVSSGTGSSSGDVYSGISPSNVVIGAAPSGTDFTGMNFNEFIETISIAYQFPVFSTFSITGQNTLIEVGDLLTGAKTFVWLTTNNSNIENSSLKIINVNTAEILGDNLNNDGSEVLNIGSIVNTAPISQVFRISGINSKLQEFIKNLTIQSIYPYFYGKVSAPGAAGTNRPVINQALIDGGTKVLASANGTITIPFNSTSNDYPWFAIPTGSPVKTVWFESNLNSGAIGGAITVGGNLFPDRQVLLVTTAKWAGVSFDVYLSNYQTSIISCDIKNS